MMGPVISVPSTGAASILLIPGVIPTPQQRNQTHQGREDRALQPCVQSICTVVNTQVHARRVNTAPVHENWLLLLTDDRIGVFMSRQITKLHVMSESNLGYV